MHSTDTIPICVIQLSSQRNVQENLHVVREQVEKATQEGAAWIVLPENLAYFGPEVGKRSIAEPLRPGGGPIFDTLADLAARHRRWIIAGGIPEKSNDPDRPYNTCAVLAPDGSLHARYRKIHLFEVDLPNGLHISEYVANTPGQRTVVCDMDGWRVGLSICYDLRFPEHYRSLADQGAEVVVVPAAFTVATGKDHWHVLLRARAIENQVYVLAPGLWGRHGKHETYGKSLVADPWGDVVAQCSDGIGRCHARLTRQVLDRVRKTLPALRHRR